jgi:integrase
LVRILFNGERVRDTAKTRNKRVAEQIEAAKRTHLAKGEVGIEEHKKSPTLKGFAPRFEKFIESKCEDKPATVDFYKSKMRAMLAGKIADMRLDAIEEEQIQDYVEARRATKTRRNRPMSPASVNRELATLKRLLRLAYRWKLIRRVPVIELLRGEKGREFVLSPAQEVIYLRACPPLLADVAAVLLDSRLRVGELVKLQWPQVHLEPLEGAKFGYLKVLSGNAKNKKSRNVPLSERAVSVLSTWGPKPGGRVFHREDGSALTGSRLDQIHADVRKLLKMPSEFVLHSLRHTFGTRLGESGADAFTIMRLMGHSSVTVSQKYVHPSPETLELAFGRLADMNRRQVPTISPTVENEGTGKMTQVV